MSDLRADGSAVLWIAAAETGDPQPLIAAGVPTRLASLLMRRGVRTAAEAWSFLEPSLDDLHDPYLLPEAQAAVDRLLAAVRQQEKVAIVGDYDVDGVSATALLVASLRACGAEVFPILPERLVEGYGFQPLHVEAARTAGCGLIITADCGSSSNDAARAAIDTGIDVIVTDHHLGGGVDLPSGVVEVNPHRPESEYPFPALSGVGVVYKLVTALLAAVDREVSQEALLRIACLGTICDLVPLVDENRIIAAKGLEALPRTRSVGLWSLMSRASVKPPVTAVDVGYRIGPRLNAAGRLASPRLALDLLLTSDDSEARRLSEELDNLNRQRQQAEMAVVEDAEARIRAVGQLPAILVAWSEHWHPGVLGIAAGRVARTFHRPAILLQTADGLAKGSGRSIPGVHLYEFLSQWRDDYDRFGGHAQAIGITVRSDDLDRLRERWQTSAAATWDTSLLTRTLEYELDLDPVEIDVELLGEIERLQPFGVGNRQPLVRVGPLQPASSPRQFGRGHLSVKAVGHESKPIDLVGWGWQDRAADLTGEFEVIATLNRDRYHNGPSLQLIDARPVAESES